MDTIIYYFSATGNSLYAVQDLAKQLGDTKTVSLTDTEGQEIDLSFDKIGFVFPVYQWGIPPIVERFLQKLGCASESKYVFAIVTCKDSPGAVLNDLQKKLKSKNLSLSAGFTVNMPGNNIIYYSTESKEVQQSKFNNWNRKRDEIVSIIHNKDRNNYQTKSIIKQYLLTSCLHQLIAKSYHKADKNYWSNSNCKACGICVKVCPVKNIEIVNNKPVWLHRCEQCTACINLCPNQAIQFSKFTANKKRYKNPFIQFEDLYRNK